MHYVVTKQLPTAEVCAAFLRISERRGAVHSVTTRRRFKGREHATHLLRRSYREEGRVKNETLSDLSHLPEPLIDIVRGARRSCPPRGSRSCARENCRR